MAQHSLQAEDITSIPQKTYGCSVSQCVRRAPHAFYARLLAIFLDNTFQATLANSLSIISEEEKVEILGDRLRPVTLDISPYDALQLPTNGDDTLLPAFP